MNKKSPSYIPQLHLLTLNKVKQALKEAISCMQLAPDQEKHWLQHIEKVYQLRKAQYYIDYHYRRWQQQLAAHWPKVTSKSVQPPIKPGGKHATSTTTTQTIS